MKKQPSQITIYERAGKYYADVQGCFGGGYSGAFAGSTPEEAALFLLREEGRYIKNNPKGGNVYAPPEVQEAIRGGV